MKPRRPGPGDLAFYFMGGFWNVAKVRRKILEILFWQEVLIEPEVLLLTDDHDGEGKPLGTTQACRGLTKFKLDTTTGVFDWEGVNLG